MGKKRIKRKGGVFDQFLQLAKRMRASLGAKRDLAGMVPRWMIARSKYMPHQSAKERERRILQMERYWTREPGCKLSPDGRGQRVR